MGMGVVGLGMMTDRHQLAVGRREVRLWDMVAVSARAICGG